MAGGVVAGGFAVVGDAAAVTRDRGAEVEAVAPLAD